MKTRRARYHGHRFPAEIISHAIWLYHRFCLSFRDVEDLWLNEASSSPTKPFDIGVGSSVLPMFGN